MPMVVIGYGSFPVDDVFSNEECFGSDKKANKYLTQLRLLNKGCVILRLFVCSALRTNKEII